MNLRAISLLLSAFSMAAVQTPALRQQTKAPKDIKSEQSLPSRYPYVVQDVLRICQRDFVLVLRSPGSDGDPFDGQRAALTGHPNANGSLRICGKKALSISHGLGERTPGIVDHQELPFDLFAHQLP